MKSHVPPMLKIKHIKRQEANTCALSATRRLRCSRHSATGVSRVITCDDLMDEKAFSDRENLRLLLLMAMPQNGDPTCAHDWPRKRV